MSWAPKESHASRPHHRSHWPGRPASGSAPAREGLSSLRCRQGAEQSQARDDARRVSFRRDRSRRPGRPSVAREGSRSRSTARGLQPGRHLVRGAVVEPGRTHVQSHGHRCSAHARSRPHGGRRPEQHHSLLSSLVIGDVRQSARDSAIRDDAVPSAFAVRLREGVRPSHHRQLPRELRPLRLLGHSLQSRGSAPWRRVRHSQGHQRGRAHQTRSPGRRGHGQPRCQARLGLRRRLREGDVAHAPTGRARRLRDRHR